MRDSTLKKGKKRWKFGVSSLLECIGCLIPKKIFYDTSTCRRSSKMMTYKIGQTLNQCIGWSAARPGHQPEHCIPFPRTPRSCESPSGLLHPLGRKKNTQHGEDIAKNYFVGVWLREHFYQKKSCEGKVSVILRTEIRAGDIFGFVDGLENGSPGHPDTPARRMQAEGWPRASPPAVHPMPAPGPSFRPFPLH